MTSFYTEEELSSMGFQSVGEGCKISRKASFYGISHISIGDNVRIDDFCILSAGKRIIIGNYVHIACYTSLIGAEDIIISDFCSISGRVSIYSSSDDYSGRYMTNPMVPVQFTNVTNAPVILNKHVIIGCASVILPGVTLEEGVAIGALSLVDHSCISDVIYCGNPLKKIIPRSKKYRILENQLKQVQHGRKNLEDYQSNS
ncbi:galactoside O-acetyltransferase [Mediterranea sp. An20]|uniref:acyltransferase n=1 Tax=Mediterranea sp. An20 TaxID=1965586 RepID=UPI000B3A8207|nr:acyltransferase [Mediterranea sp. An20]OUP07879.1 galactoside O-acetyltransferase [Mediterranea sp. An20]